MLTFDLAAGNLSDRRFQLFAVSTYAPSEVIGNVLYSCWKETTQPGAKFTNWERWIGPGQTGGPPTGSLAGVTRSCPLQLFDDRLMLLVLDPTGQVFVTLKLSADANAGWSPWTRWTQLPLYKDLAATRLIGPDSSQGSAFQGMGRAQVFAVTPAGQIQTFWQLSSDPSQFFMPPQDFSIPGLAVNKINAAQLWSGQVQVWAVDQNGFLWSRWKKFNYANPQDPDTEWVDWGRFITSGPTSQLPFPVLHISSSRLSDGRVQLFALSQDPANSSESQIWSSWQQWPAVDSGWTSWSQFPAITYNDPNHPGQPANVPLKLTVARLSATNRTQLWAVSQSPPQNSVLAGTVWTCWNDGAGTGYVPWQFMDPAL